MNFSKGPSLSPLPWYFVCGKSTHCTCAFLLCGGFLCGLHCGFGGGAGGGRLAHRRSFLRSKREKEKSFGADAFPINQPCREDGPGASPILRARGVGDFFFQLFFADCAVVSDGYGSWKEDLTTGQRGRDFLQPFFTEKPSKSFGAAESSWGKTPTSSAVVIADNEL